MWSENFHVESWQIACYVEYFWSTWKAKFVMFSKIAAHAPRTVTNFMYAFPFYTLCLMPLGPALWINGTIHLFGPGKQFYDTKI